MQQTQTIHSAIHALEQIEDLRAQVSARQGKIAVTNQLPPDHIPPGAAGRHEASQSHSGCPEPIQAAEKVISRTRLNWGIKDIQKASRLN